MPFSLQFADRPVVLVGMMGAGKTTVGRALGERLGRAFFDADEEVEREAGRSIPDIFEREGERAFRERERQVMQRLIAGTRCVVAAGGGAFLDREVRTAILDRCTAIWLKAEPELLAARLANCQGRPLLRGKDRLGELRRLIAERAPVYAEAQLHVPTGAEPVPDIVERILAALPRIAW